MLEFFEEPPLSKAEKHSNLQVTLCYHFDSTNVKFVYVESEIMQIFCFHWIKYTSEQNVSIM
jgi:hypothetical protein